MATDQSSKKLKTSRFSLDSSSDDDFQVISANIKPEPDVVFAGEKLATPTKPVLAVHAKPRLLVHARPSVSRSFENAKLLIEPDPQPSTALQHRQQVNAQQSQTVKTLLAHQVVPKDDPEAAKRILLTGARPLSAISGECGRHSQLFTPLNGLVQSKMPLCSSKSTTCYTRFSQPDASTQAPLTISSLSKGSITSLISCHSIQRISRIGSQSRSSRW